MTTATISPAAKAAQDAARRSNGQFGEQTKDEPSLDLEPVDGEVNVRIDTVYSELDKDSRYEAMKADLMVAIEQIVNSGQLASFLNKVSANGMSRWSFNNRLLAWAQAMHWRDQLDPDGSRGLPAGPMVMTAKAWKEKFNRHPAAGTKAIWILAPNTRRIVEDDPDRPGQKRNRVIVTGFRGMPVFDVCQTDGDPLPEDLPLEFNDAQIAESVYPHLAEKVGSLGYTFSEEDIEGSGDPSTRSTLGYTDPTSKRIVVDSRLPAAQKAQTVAHELGHVLCGHTEDGFGYREHRGQAETEAEMTSYLVAREMGLPAADSASFSAGYIAGWSKGDVALIEKSFTAATRAANKITEGFRA